MERAYDLNQQEQLRALQLQQENQTLLARFGAATLELEAVRPALAQVQTQQRDLIGQALTRHGVQNFQAARIEGNHLIARLPDEIEPAIQLPPLPKTNSVQKSAKE